MLVDIQTIIPSITVDLRYATKDNFTGEVVYPFKRCLVLQPVAIALDRVQKELEAQGLSLKVWDGYRPISAQWKFWEIMPDERYVSDPRKGGRHTRGTAIDVTLMREGVELEMPSLFDDFSERAHLDYQGASAQALRNRDFLIAVMEKHGFLSIPTEWWHFDFSGWEQCPPLDVDVTAFKE
jgi:D-alanyl-D-alanine dipeptidase